MERKEKQLHSSKYLICWDEPKYWENYNPLSLVVYANHLIPSLCFVFQFLIAPSTSAEDAMEQAIDNARGRLQKLGSETLERSYRYNEDHNSICSVGGRFKKKGLKGSDAAIQSLIVEISSAFVVTRDPLEKESSIHREYLLVGAEGRPVRESTALLRRLKECIAAK